MNTIVYATEVTLPMFTCDLMDTVDLTRYVRLCGVMRI